jgi:tetratricopeptide (TPR) repeat protein
LSRNDLRGAHSACLRLLALDANHADAYFLLGMIAAAANNMGKARELIDRAIALDATRAEYFAQLARCLALLKLEPEARSAAHRAEELGLESALTVDTVGVVYSRLGEHERAVRCFERAVAAEPANPSYRYNLAASLRFLGRFDAAEQAYEAAIAAAPNMYRAHSALADLKTQTPEANHIERLQALLAAVGENVDGELHLCHALAKESEDLGRYEQAFDYLLRGKAKKRATLNYTIERDRTLFDSLGKLFDSGAAWATEAGCDTDEPIFVVGMPRTGTTLVERILTSHAAVSSAGELQNFGICLKRAAATPSNQVLDEETLSRGMQVDPGALGRAYLESTRPVTGHVPHFVDKMPLNFFYIGFIHRALPKAKIVCLRRDPLDTCLSNFRQLFAVDFSYYNYAYDIEDTGRYYAMFDRLMAMWSRLLPGKILQLRYERLVEDQEGETRRLLSHCGLPWDPACLAFQNNAAPVATASAVQVRRGLNRDSIGRWRHYESRLGGLRAQLTRAGLVHDESALGAQA